MRTPHALLLGVAVALAGAAALTSAAAWADTTTTTAAAAAGSDTHGCPVPGISAVCPAYEALHIRSRLAKRGISKRRYAPGVWAHLSVNASSFGTAAASTAPALNAYTGGANEAGHTFHDTEPAALMFKPTPDFTAVAREFTAARFLDVAQAADAPPPTQNADIRVCKTGKRGNAVYVAGWTSASPFPGPPTAATVLAHAKALASRLDEAGERYCSRSAWLLSYTPDSQTVGRKLFEVTLDAGRCRDDGGGGGGGCEEEEVDAEAEAGVPRPPLALVVGAE